MIDLDQKPQIRSDRVCRVADMCKQYPARANSEDPDTKYQRDS